MQDLSQCHLDIEKRGGARRLARLLDPVPMFEAFTPQSPGRDGVEHYIARKYLQSHRAVIRDFLPLLVSMRCGGAFSTAAGLRSAGRGELFLERYLDAPVESVLRARGNRCSGREGIIEVGNLVATRDGASYLLFLALSEAIARAGFEWCVFTATPTVARVLSNLGVVLQDVCTADPDRLPPSQRQHWGRYYESVPRVVAGRVHHNLRHMRQRPLFQGVFALLNGTLDELAVSIREHADGHGTRVLVA